jgi:CIC family chloride channel protein
MQLKPVFKSIFSSPFWVILLQIYVIGIGAALTAILLRNGMRGLNHVRLDLLDSFPDWMVLPFIGLGGGAIAGSLVQWVESGAAGSGFPQLIEFFKDASAPLNWRTAITKLIGGIFVIGSGFPLGVEGPSAHMGASIASQLSQWFSASEERRRLLVATGAGAGIAAAFNAPLGGFAYAIESLIKDISPGIVLPIAIGAMVADFWGQVFGYQGLRLLAGANFTILYQFEVDNASYAAIDVPFLILLGGLAGLLAPLFDASILRLQSLIWHRWRLRPVAAIASVGLLIGLIYAFLPHNFRDSVALQSALVEGQLNWQVAAVGLVTTLALTILAAASKAPGGLFSSMLTVGGALGLLVNALANHWIAYNPPTLVIAGMGAFMSAVTRSPLSSIIITFELTKNFLLYHPLMISCVIAYLVARLFSSKSLFERMGEG